MDFRTAQKEAISGWFSRDDCRIKVKALEVADLDAVNEECSTIHHEFVHNPEKGRLERVEWVDEGDTVQKSIALGSRLITEWENVQIDGKDAECTDENKRRLIADSVEFRNFYTESLNALTEQIKKQYGSDRPAKNSKSTRRKR